MSEPTTAKRRRYDNMTTSEAKQKRERENWQERGRHDEIGQAQQRLYSALPPGATSGKTSKIAILRAAIRHILELERIISDADTLKSQSSCSSVNDQQNISHMQQISILGLQPDTQVTNGRDNELLQNVLDCLDETNQKQITTNYKPALAACYQGIDQSFHVNNSTCQERSPVYPSGHVAQIGLSGSFQCLPQMFQQYVPPTIMPGYLHMATYLSMHGQSIIPAPLVVSGQIPMSTPSGMQGQLAVPSLGTTSNQGYVLQNTASPTEDLIFLASSGSLNTTVPHTSHDAPLNWSTLSRT